MLSSPSLLQDRKADLLRRSFLLMLRAEGKSPTTVRRYKLNVRQYQVFAHEMGFPDQPTREHVSHFLSSRSDRLAANTTRNDYMGLRRYFRFLREEGEITADPLEHVRPPKVTEKSPDPYRPDEIKALLNACRGKSFDDVGNSAVILTLLDTACGHPNSAPCRSRTLYSMQSA